MASRRLQAKRAPFHARLVIQSTMKESVIKILKLSSTAKDSRRPFHAHLAKNIRKNVSMPAKGIGEHYIKTIYNGEFDYVSAFQAKPLEILEEKQINEVGRLD